MNEKIYKYPVSRRVWGYSLLYVVGLSLLAVALYFLYEGGYLSAWFSSCILALLLLMALSIPRKIRLNEERLRIDCLMDLTEIPLEEILSVRRLDNREMRGVLPLLGGFGFFGYYGYYLDVVQVEVVRLYASEWRNFVEITDIYENRLIVSCPQAEELVEELQKRMAARSEEESREKEE